MENIVIYGAGSVGRLVEQIIRDINDYNYQYNLLGFLDDDETTWYSAIHGIRIVGGVNWICENPEVSVVLGFSNPKKKYELLQKLRSIGQVNFPAIIHPSAWVSSRVQIGEGSIIYPGVLIDVDVKLGRFVLLNKSCTIGHDTEVSDFTTFSPGVNLGGFNTVGQGVEFGINSCTTQYITVGAWTVVGAGTVIIKDIQENDKVVGNPARSIKFKGDKG